MDHSALRFLIYFFVHSVPFTRAVIEGRTSLGGSESACLGLASALAARGHDVHIFATQLRLEDSDPSAYAGVQWHPAETLIDTLAFAPPDVFCSLRDPSPFAKRIGAKLNLLWNQDLLQDLVQVSGALPQIDRMVYVSEFHRQQWSGIEPSIIGAMPSYVTRNAVDAALIDQGAHWIDRDGKAQLVERRPLQFAHISRPERGLEPLLQMWPAIRARLPEATLHVCRYDSMYDAGGWGKICAQYDQMLARVQAQVGGIVMEGQLDKVSLYRLLHQSALLLYPGVHDFAETSCIAVIEGQACGAIPVCSYRGALPETIGAGAGILVDGDALSPAYQDAYVDEVCELVASPARRAAMRAAGLAHVLPAYTFDAVAADWEGWLQQTFRDRYEGNKIGVLRQLLHWDNHGQARVVADEISNERAVAGCDKDDPAYVEAVQAIRLCDRVIAQQDLDEEGYSTYALDTVYEADNSARINEVADRIAELNPATILDVACGNGAMILCLCRRLPNARITGYDFSPGVLETAWAAIRAAGFSSRVTLHQGSWDTIKGQYDVVFSGEFLEHVEHPHLVVNRLEQHAKPGGRVFITTPCGPFAELLDYTVPRKRGHVHAFSMRDIGTLFGQKPGTTQGYMGQGYSPRGSGVGYWIVSWQPGGPPAPPLEYGHTILTARPYRRVVAGMIVRNEEQWIRKCLASIWPQVDDIVVVDTGCQDKTVAIAKEYGAHVYPFAWRDHFAAARNESLRLAVEHHAADWFLWIDADEHLVGENELHKYLEGESPFNAFVIRQHHLMLDSDRFFDVPCRLFRTDAGIEFYGVVHEQPAQSKDDGLYPSLDTPDLNIVHYGYETEGTRRGKLLLRNLDLLKKELRMGDEARDMAWLLFVRELVTLAGYEGADKPQQQTPQQHARMQHFLRAALLVYRQRGFDKPTHKLHHLIFPSYGLALKWLGVGVEVEWAFAAAVGGLKGHPKPERIRVADPDEGRLILTHKLDTWLGLLKPTPMACEPWTQARPADRVEAIVEAPAADAAPILDASALGLLGGPEDAEQV